MPIEKANLSIAAKLLERYNQGKFQSCENPVIHPFPRCIPKPILSAAESLQQGGDLLSGFSRLVDTYDADHNGRLQFRKNPWDQPLEGDRLIKDYDLWVL